MGYPSTSFSLGRVARVTGVPLFINCLCLSLIIVVKAFFFIMNRTTFFRSFLFSFCARPAVALLLDRLDDWFCLLLFTCKQGDALFSCPCLSIHWPVVAYQQPRHEQQPVPLIGASRQINDQVAAVECESAPAVPTAAELVSGRGSNGLFRLAAPPELFNPDYEPVVIPTDGRG